MAAAPLDLIRVSERPPDGISLWVVYKSPKDLPHIPYVVREQVATAGTLWINPEAYGFNDLEAARAWLTQLGSPRGPWGLVCVPRDPDDDAVIVESWV
jgi:hypothetical protein